jgi:hypothetical protein
MKNEIKNSSTEKAENSGYQVNISSREHLKGNVDFARVVVTDTTSGKVVSTKRVVLLAD